MHQGNPIDISKIPESEIVGVTGILLTCSYNGHEFFRVGYYVNNFYEDPEMNENPPAKPDIEKLTRHILIEKPRVTKFQITWEDDSNVLDQENNQNTSNMMGAPDSDDLAKLGMRQDGTQLTDRNDMMSSANLAQAAQNFLP